MHDRFPITGIKQSYYRPTRETRTVVMPLLIVALFVALGTFYLKSDPDRLAREAEAELAATEAAITETASLLDDAGEASAAIGSAGSIQAATPPALIATPVETTLPPLPGEPTLIATGSPEEEFTVWMTPLALDTYIRQINGSSQKSYWQQGHWISAVEGRWSDSSHEFRIVFGKMPTNGKWHWQYRANQALDAFIRSDDEMKRQGYTMVQSQAFARPDGSRRYQGVWHKREGMPPAMVEEQQQPLPSIPAATTITGAAQSYARPAAAGGGALDVNRLRFQ